MINPSNNGVRAQLDRLIIESQSEDGSIEIHEQLGMRNDLLNLIESTVNTIIGEDEPEDSLSSKGSESIEPFFRNQLRATQRANLAKLIGKEEV